MPKFEALYYPTFEPPAIWLRSFLLFFDRIRTIVPDDVDFKPSEKISRLVDLIPDVFETVSVEEQDVDVDELNLRRMRSAFQIIGKREPEANREEIKIIIDKDGSVSIAGHTFLHDRKMSGKVRSLLEEFKLIKSELDEIAEVMGAENFSIVNENASDLIVSQVADRIAKRYGWNTVTDRKIDFTMNALNAFQSGLSRTEPQGMLVCSIINCEIPQEIRHAGLKKYKAIREAYSDIREPFQRAVVDLSDLYRIEAIEDKQILEQRVREITREFNTEVEKYKKSNFGRKVSRWIPIGIGGLASLAGVVFAEPTITISSAVVSVAIQVVQELSRMNESESESNNVHRLIARMQKDILRAAEVKRLL